MKTLLSVLAMAAVSAGAFAIDHGPPDVSAHPVLLELFTSEGCSSCPPADRLLQDLDRQPVPGVEFVVLGEHVDYWNYLGWRDPFSSSLFSERQRKYVSALGSTVYTPQLVVNGREQVLGSDRRAILAATARAIRFPETPVTVTSVVRESSLQVHVTADGEGRNPGLYIAIASEREATAVSAGENGGQVLTHVGVVQTIVSAGRLSGTGIRNVDTNIPVKPSRSKLRVIAFLQDPKSLAILAVGHASPQ